MASSAPGTAPPDTCPLFKSKHTKDYPGPTTMTFLVYTLFSTLPYTMAVMIVYFVRNLPGDKRSATLIYLANYMD